MKDITKYQGVIPAFYACYDAEGNISTEGVKALTRHLIAKGVKGVYVGGSGSSNDRYVLTDKSGRFCPHRYIRH